MSELPQAQKTIAAQCKVHGAEIELEISKHAAEKAQELYECATKVLARDKALLPTHAIAPEEVDKAEAECEVAHQSAIIAALDVELKKTMIDQLKAELYCDLNPSPSSSGTTGTGGT